MVERCYHGDQKDDLFAKIVMLSFCRRRYTIFICAGVLLLAEGKIEWRIKKLNISF